MAKLYKVEIGGLEVCGINGHQPLGAWFEAKSDSDAIQRAARVSAGIGVAHSVQLSRCIGIIPSKTILSRECGAGECW